jgi:hypothetical protein
MPESDEDKRNRQADVAWIEYRRTGEFVSNEAMTAWLDTWGTDREQLELPLLEALEGGGSREFTPDFFERLRERARQAIKAKESEEH